MGVPDTVTKEYVGRDDIFADIVNYTLFQGEPRVCGKDLEERDVAELFSWTDKSGKQQALQVTRDLLKLCVCKSFHGLDILLLVGIENQTNIHYAMPVRNLMADAMNYSGQVKRIAHEHEESHDLRDGDEYLSGFSRRDHIMPVITITVYFGSKPWDGPRSLFEMFDIEDQEILKYVSDYKLNLIVPAEIADPEKFRTSFGSVMSFIASSHDKSKMKELLKKNSGFRLNDRDARRVIESCTSTKIDEDYYTDEGGINMCKAWEDYRLEGKEEGLEAGRLDSIVFSIQSLKKTLHLSITEAMDALCVSAEDRNKIQHRIQM